MPKRSRKTAGEKPGKPYEGFPLFVHKSGKTLRWCKKIRQRLRYFGPVLPEGDHGAAAALERYQEQAGDLHAGREPRSRGQTATVLDCVNAFLLAKEQARDAGELAPRTFDRYFSSCARVIECFGKTRPAADLRPEDFQELRRRLAARYSAIPLGNEIGMVRTLFKFCYEADVLPVPVKFGPTFRKPSAKTVRAARIANGPRMFTPQQIRAAVDSATPNMRAMIYLAINCGLGNSDLAYLPRSAVDLRTGWLDHPRIKTAIPRRVPLWPETVEAIKAALAVRAEPNDPEAAGLLFIGRRGESYIGENKGYRVHQEWARVAKAAGIKGRQFYDFRRTFQTVAEGSRDLAAVQSIMGHAAAASDMSAIYRQRIDDDRLQAVSEFVRAWLFAKKGGAQ